MKLNIFLILFCLNTSVLLCQEDLPNEVESVYINEQNSPKLQKIIFRNKDTGKVVSEFDINKNNPFANISHSSVERLLKNNTDFRELKSPFAYRSHPFLTIPSEVDELSYKSDKYISLHYTLFVEDKESMMSCGETKTLYSSTKFIVLDNTGNIYKEIENIENYSAHRSLVSEDGKFLIYTYSEYNEEIGGFKKAGFIIFDLLEKKIKYNYRSDLSYCSDIPFFSMTSGSVFQILTGRKSHDDEGLIAYIDTKEKAIYELELPSNHIIGKRLISLDFKNDGLHFEYKNGSEHVAFLDIFLEIFCWD